jgi:hypothetical protein
MTVLTLWKRYYLQVSWIQWKCWQSCIMSLRRWGLKSFQGPRHQKMKKVVKYNNSQVQTNLFFQSTFEASICIEPFWTTLLLKYIKIQSDWNWTDILLRQLRGTQRIKIFFFHCKGTNATHLTKVSSKLWFCILANTAKFF